MSKKVDMNILEMFLNEQRETEGWVGRLRSRVACRSGRLGWSWMKVSNCDVEKLKDKGFDFFINGDD